jgi:hypothetical protein
MFLRERKYLGWKTLGVFVVTYVAAWFAGALWGLGATQVGRLLHCNDSIISTLSLAGLAVIWLFAWATATRMVLQRRLRDLSFSWRRYWWADWLAGILITTLALLAVFLFCIKADWLAVEGWKWQTLPWRVFLGKLWVSLLVNAQVAIFEELVFRAYLLTGLKEAWGAKTGLLVMTGIFGIIHIMAYNRPGLPPLILAFALLLPAAVGALFGWVYLRTGSLWLPVAAHFAWDFVEGDLLNLSADVTNSRLIGAVTQIQGPFRGAGMEYGNAIVLNMFALAIILLGVMLWFKVGPRRDC